MRRPIWGWFALSLCFLLFPTILAGVDEPLSYESFYQVTYQKCHQQAEEQGVNACEPNVVNCMNQDFLCLRQEAECSLSSNGKSSVSCKKTGACPVDMTALILKYKSEGKDCSDLAPDFSKPGCGNAVTEIHEKCDDGNTAGNDECPADCGVAVAPAAVPEGAPSSAQDSAVTPTEPRTSSCALKK